MHVFLLSLLASALSECKCRPKWYENFSTKHGCHNVYPDTHIGSYCLTEVPCQKANRFTPLLRSSWNNLQPPMNEYLNSSKYENADAYITDITHPLFPVIYCS